MNQPIDVLRAGNSIVYKRGDMYYLTWLDARLEIDGYTLVAQAVSELERIARQLKGDDDE